MSQRSASPLPVPPGSPADAGFERLLEQADLADLARLAQRVLGLADAAARPWRPRTMHEWLT